MAITANNARNSIMTTDFFIAAPLPTVITLPYIATTRKTGMTD